MGKMPEERVNGFKTGQQIASEQREPAVFLRKGKNGGLYFFSPSGNRIFYARQRDVLDVIEGRREYAMFASREVEKK